MPPRAAGAYTHTPMATKQVTLELTARNEIGSRPSRRLRADDHIPAVLYGQQVDPVAVTVERRSLRAALTTDAGLNALITLKVGDREQLGMVREVQQDPVKNRVLHVDFLAIDTEHELRVDVPIITEGEAEAVDNVEGGTIDQTLHSLSVLSKPLSIPNDIRVDISNMEIGDTIRVGDLILPDGVTANIDADEPVAVAKIVTVEVPEPVAEEELLEGEEGEAVEGEEGEGEATEGEEASAEGGEGADEG